MKSKSLLALALITLFTLAACNAGPEATPPEETEEAPGEEMTEEENNEEPTTEEEVTDEVETVKEVEAPAETLPEPQYKEYSESAYNEALENSRPFAIFFHASWCPTCVGMEKDYKENLSSFPKGTQILVADYDTETDLKAKYGILMQSTVAIIHSDGTHLETLVVPNSKELKTKLNELL